MATRHVTASAARTTHFAPIGVPPECAGRYTCARYRTLSDKAVFQHAEPRAPRVTVRRMRLLASSRTTVALSEVWFATTLMRLSALGGSRTFAKVVPSTRPPPTGTTMICAQPGRRAVRRPAVGSTVIAAGSEEIQRKPAAVVSVGRHSGDTLWENVARIVTVSPSWRTGAAGSIWATRIKQRSGLITSLDRQAAAA